MSKWTANGHDDQSALGLKGQKEARYVAVVIEDVDHIAEILTDTTDLAPITPFQSRDWLLNTYQVLVPDHSARPCLVVVRHRTTGSIVLALPLISAEDRGLTVAGFPSFGVADYGAPLVSALQSLSDQDMQAIWVIVRASLTGVDRLSLQSMPKTVDGHTNPLACLSGVMPARHARYVVHIEGALEEYLRARGKKYRKEVERCYRLLQSRGSWTFRKAETDNDIEQAFGHLDRLQESRWQGGAGDYRLSRGSVSDFYQRALHSDDQSEGAQIFTLESVGEPIAVLYGLLYGPTFTLLRIASATGAARRFSPGRLVVLESMRSFLDRNISTFDLGIGDYAFKRGLGAHALPLFDLEQSLTVKARPHVMLMQAKGWLRTHPRLLRAAKAVRQKLSAHQGRAGDRTPSPL